MTESENERSSSNNSDACNSLLKVNTRQLEAVGYANTTQSVPSSAELKLLPDLPITTAVGRSSTQVICYLLQHDLPM
jgi:hypothetical protein